MLTERLNVVPLSIKHCITTACGSGGTAPQFLTLAVQEGFPQPVTLILAKNILISTRLGGPQSWSRSSGELKNLLPLVGIELACSAIQPVVITVVMCNSGSWMLSEYV
jgi:hypothetical protein